MNSSKHYKNLTKFSTGFWQEIWNIDHLPSRKKKEVKQVACGQWHTIAHCDGPDPVWSAKAASRFARGILAAERERERAALFLSDRKTDIREKTIHKSKVPCIRIQSHT